MTRKSWPAAGIYNFPIHIVFVDVTKVYFLLE